jgi:hypothetical protein
MESDNGNIETKFFHDGKLELTKDGSKKSIDVYSVLFKPKEYSGFEILENKTLSHVQGSTLTFDSGSYNIREASYAI